MRRQLAEAQDVARRLESTWNSMTKNQGEIERLLSQERARTAQLKEQVSKTEAESPSRGSWSEVGSQKPPMQQECQGPPQAAEQRALEAEEA